MLIVDLVVLKKLNISYKKAKKVDPKWKEDIKKLSELSVDFAQKVIVLLHGEQKERQLSI